MKSTFLKGTSTRAPGGLRGSERSIPARPCPCGSEVLPAALRAQKLVARTASAQAASAEPAKEAVAAAPAPTVRRRKAFSCCCCCCIQFFVFTQLA